MDYTKLSEILFPNISKAPKDYEEIYPPRNLPQGAKVTRLGPSPTGFIHLGNLYGAFVDERLAHQSGGTFYLRIEDTDDKRQVEGAIEAIIESLNYFGLEFDEGITLDGELGQYGPYKQSERAEIYQCYAKWLVSKGLAYPCFCTEDEIQEMRNKQESAKETPGYYGKWANCRELDFDAVEKKLNNNMPFVIRLKSYGDPKKNFQIIDGIRGELSMPENFQDVIILKQNGIPTYHFAHVIDDHLMRTTHVVRGEEWLSSLPIHVALFKAMDWELPVYCHTTVLMKADGDTRRKLSKRNDPELSLNYYRSLGYHPEAVREYLMTILNSNYEEWRLENPDSPIDEFEFTTEKMSSSGTLFDLDKLNDISKEVIARIDDEDLYEFMLEWANNYKEELVALFKENESMMLRILAMDRHGEKPRKDLIYCEQIFDYISYFFDEYYKVLNDYPENVDRNDLVPIINGYLETYDPNDDQTGWFSKIRELATNLGYAAKPKDYRKNPEQYKGHVGDVSTVIRVALMGRRTSPDLWEIQQIMGEEKVRDRFRKAIEAL
ncbi:MAG: glutamate--tRNA ligase [Clostridiales bacterium]|nr:glutamate--tRNA ligase [Clostridiales bacterium]